MPPVCVTTGVTCTPSACAEARSQTPIPAATTAPAARPMPRGPSTAAALCAALTSLLRAVGHDSAPGPVDWQSRLSVSRFDARRTNDVIEPAASAPPMPRATQAPAGAPPEAGLLGGLLRLRGRYRRGPRRLGRRRCEGLQRDGDRDPASFRQRDTGSKGRVARRRRGDRVQTRIERHSVAQRSHVGGRIVDADLRSGGGARRDEHREPRQGAIELLGP